jgi:uncharacterized protein (DUF1778 family)
MGTAIAKQVRIGARVPYEDYETVCRAAELGGATVDQFLVQAALKEARAVIEREDVIRLSPRDWNWLLDLMENPPEPNARLKAALKRYQEAKLADDSCLQTLVDGSASYGGGKPPDHGTIT